jgi:hypothetical protein
MTASVSVSVEMADGLIGVFIGCRSDGSANWKFFRKRRDGSLRPAKPTARVLRQLEKANAAE